MTDTRPATYLTTRDIPLDELTPFPGNAKRGDVEAIRASLRRNGQYRSLVVREIPNGPLIVLAGNHTLQALANEGRTEARCEIVHCDDATARRINLADNRTAELGHYDDDALTQLLDALDGDYDGTGWAEEDLASLVTAREELPPMLGDPDDVPEPPVDPVSKPGDLWILGPHRLICGDSTDPHVWDRLLEGQRPKVVFTDPPYGIAYQAMRGGSAIANDASPNEALQVTKDALALLYDAEAHFVCCDWRSLGTIIDAMVSAAIEPKATIVWDKQSRVQNLDRYAKQHEFIVYSGPYGGQPTQCTDVWVHPRDFEPDHPTPKPVSLIHQALTTASQPGDVVADAFAGSGSTLLAAHATGRIARVCELDPRYTDVICRRFQQTTGTRPILEATGLPHDFNGAMFSERMER